MNMHIVLKAFGRDICEGKITIKEAHEYQTDLLVEIINFKKQKKPRSQEKKREKEIVLQNLYIFFEGREKILDAFGIKMFSIKSKGSGILNPDHSKLKIQMLERLPIVFAQVKAGNNSESLLNEIRQIVYYFTSLKKSPKKYTIT